MSAVIKMRGRLIGAAVVLIVLFSPVLFSPVGGVLAHAQLERTSPAASSVVPNSPPQILLDFSESIELKLGEIRLFGRDNREISLGALRYEGNDKSIVLADVPQLDTGPYVVVWNVTSMDGHSLNGAFTFEVGNQTSGESAELLETVITTINTDSPLSPYINVLRYFTFFSIALMIGLVVLVGAGDLLSERIVMATLSASLAVLFGSSLGHLLLQGPYVTRQSWGAIGDFEILREVIDTRIGLSLLVRLALLVVAAILLLGVHRNWHRSPYWSNVAVFAGIGIVVTFGLSGHPSTASPAAIAVIVDSIHLWSLSVWIGGAIALAIAWRTFIRAGSTVNDIHVVSRFSRLATIAMPLTVVSGFVSAVIITDGISGIFDNRYGRLLLIKVLIVAVIVALGAGARQVLRKRGAISIRRAVFLEATLGLVVFAFSVGLVVTPPSGIDNSATSVLTATLVQDDVVVDITMSPTRVGPVEVHVILSPPGGSLDPMKNVVVTFTDQGDSPASLIADVVEVGPNHWSGFVEVPSGGNWDVVVDVTRRDETTLQYETTVKMLSR